MRPTPPISFTNKTDLLLLTGTASELVEVGVAWDKTYSTEKAVFISHFEKSQMNDVRTCITVTVELS